MSQTSLSATRVLLALESLAEEPELGVSDLSSSFGWSKSVTHRMLQSLVETGYAEQVPETDKYRLTTKLFVLGSSVVNRTGLTQVALPVMEELLAETGETVNLAVLDGTDIVFVLKVESEALLGANIRIGSRFPAHATSLGKALLASFSEGRREELLDQMKFVQYTPNTISDKEQLVEDLEATRARGYAIDREELSLAMRCVGAAIKNASGQAIAAISISVPASRLNEEELGEYGERIAEAANEISKKLGYVGQA